MLNLRQKHFYLQNKMFNSFDIDLRCT
uniref:Uncharacterized protein n=1 Tax=Rhizophora mucronata TaxID=61149 RepID=A0A2P2QF56_RHIMU